MVQQLHREFLEVLESRFMNQNERLVELHVHESVFGDVGFFGWHANLRGGDRTGNVEIGG